jgi:hypothetical protein
MTWQIFFPQGRGGYFPIWSKTTSNFYKVPVAYDHEQFCRESDGSQAVFQRVVRIASIISGRGGGEMKSSRCFTMCSGGLQAVSRETSHLRILLMEISK